MRMTDILEVSNVSFQDEADLALVVFSKQDTASCRYVMLQQAMNPTPQDIKLGQNKIYIEVDDQMRGCYGGVLSIDVSPGAITIYIDNNAAKSLGVDGNINLHVAEIKLEWLEIVDKICQKASIPVRIL
jgi:hypothetical protein